MSSEFDLIDMICRRAGKHVSVPVSIGDDAAVITPSPDHCLVTTTDTLVVDRHFSQHWPADNVGHLAMHANLSDLAAMAAIPRWALLALTLPSADEAWLSSFLDGFLAAADAASVVLVGGNICSGPMNITVELLGEVEPDRVVTRDGSRPGDRIFVTGSLGDAAAALALGEAAYSGLVDRLQRPEARVQVGRALAGKARAMIDISDGLLADLAHLLDDGLGAELRLTDLPVSEALMTAVVDTEKRQCFQAIGGNDYELLFTMTDDSAFDPAELSAQTGVRITEIGKITASKRIRCLDANGREVANLSGGWDHFAP